MIIGEDESGHREHLERALGGKFSDNVKIFTFMNPNGLGFIAYDNLTNLSVDISAAGVGTWLTRGLLRHIFSYAFDTEQVKRINAYVEIDNTASQRMIERIGFIRECQLRGTDIYLYSLLPTDTKYYEKPKT